MTDSKLIKIKPKERSAIIESLKIGIVPRTGLQHIQVGRVDEIHEMIKDFDLIAEGGAKTRFIIGDFGSGKTFFLTLSKLIAHEKNMVVFSGDISPDKILSSSRGQARNLFNELVKNMSTKNRPNGNALESIVERWASNILEDNPEPSEKDIHNILRSLEKYVNCFDFAKVLSTYIQAYRDGNDILASLALRWLSAGYSTKTEAREDLGVRTIIDDAHFYDYLKLYAGFVRMAGYNGLLVCIDELATIARLKSQTRNKNFEVLLNIINDTAQADTTEYLGFIFSGTPVFLEDKVKGMFSYGALKQRLADNPFSKKEMRDLTQPVIRLENLSQEELYVLFLNIRDVFANKDPDRYLIDDNGIKRYLQWLLNRLGSAAYTSPRESVRTFVGLLSQLENFPDSNIDDYLGKVTISKGEDTDELNNMSLDDENGDELDLVEI